MLLIKSITLNKKVFCKVFLLSIILFFLTPSVFAQHARTGVYGITQFPIGDAADYFLNASGGGACAEFGFRQNFGQSIRVHYSSVIPQDERILSAWQFTSLLGLWFNKPLGNAGFAFQPSVEMGILYQGAKIKEGYGQMPLRAYVDFEMQLCPSFRFKNPKFLNNSLEIELSPTFCLIPQKTESFLFVGGRLGLIYVFSF